MIPGNINRQILMRWIPNNDYSDSESEGLLANATPKPKKKVKLEKMRSEDEIFDSDGKFIPLLN